MIFMPVCYWLSIFSPLVFSMLFLTLTFTLPDPVVGLWLVDGWRAMFIPGVVGLALGALSALKDGKYSIAAASWNAGFLALGRVVHSMSYVSAAGTISTFTVWLWLGFSAAMPAIYLSEVNRGAR